MSDRDKHNYPPKKNGTSCHHVAYQYSWYRGELEHRRYQYNDALLLPVKNDRHNFGKFALHSLIDPVYGPPPKPSHDLMGDAVDFMEDLPDESRLRKFGHVIDFYFDQAETEVSNEKAQQAMDIATHYAFQQWIISEGGESFVRDGGLERMRDAC